MIDNQPNELTLIYHSDKPDDKKARAFVEAITDYVVKTLDLKRESLTETQLAEIADKMDVRIEMLVDSSYRDHFQKKDAESIHDVSDTDLLTLLAKVPILIKTPITIIGKKAYQYASANELLSSATVQAGLHHHNNQE
jgi:arsenate reductase-like glutaredoxin family protein